MPREQTREEAKADDRLTTLRPPCFYCKHLTEIGLQDGDAPEALSGWICPAFPNGISTMILRREVDHSDELFGQKGSKVFESNVYDYPNGPDTISFEGRWASWGEEQGEDEDAT